MNPSAVSTLHPARKWDEVRAAFASSIMVDAPLNSLAQNLEGPEWPVKGRAETPSKYIDLGYDEMREQLALQGMPPAMAERLMSILEQTLAFDEPFGDMVEQSTASSEKENPLMKNLARLEIPADFPVTLSGLSVETLSFCRLENINTVGEFALAAQTIAQRVIVGGDFRALLNALSHVDEPVLASYLPFRPGARGLHLLEALAHAIRKQSAPVRAALARRHGHTLNAVDADLASAVSRENLAEAERLLAARVEQLRTYFAADYTGFQSQLSAGMDIRRLVMALNDPSVEAVVIALLRPAPAPKAATEGTGLLSKLRRWLGR